MIESDEGNVATFAPKALGQDRQLCFDAAEILRNGLFRNVVETLQTDKADLERRFGKPVHRRRDWRLIRTRTATGLRWRPIKNRRDI